MPCGTPHPRTRSLSTLAILVVATALAGPASAAVPAPLGALIAEDAPNDRGHAVVLSWAPSADDRGDGLLDRYVIFRGPDGPDTVFDRVGVAAPVNDPGGRVVYTDVSEDIANGTPYRYQVVAENADGDSQPGPSAVVTARAQWFNAARWNMLVATLLLSAAIIYWIQRSRSADIYLRPVAGLKAFDEAVGRATEMGQPVLFVPGIMDMDQIETLAGVNILGYVANMTSRYETKLEVPVSRSLVMAHAREVVKENYLSTGRPDLYNDDMIHYLTDDQFAYAAAVDGIMLRQKPAACFYQGKFYAESLILAETGNSIGAIQIAGTASPAQLPFFITACDYTLIGEEFFAASAYLSQDRRLIGSIRGQDVGKTIFMLGIGLGILYVTLAALGVELPGWLDASKFFNVGGS